MEQLIRKHLGKGVKEKIRLKGGYTFETWLLVLSDNQKIVFRAQHDFTTGGGRKIVIADVLEREKFFYDNVNSEIGHICPEVYVIDGSGEYDGKSYCIMEYMEGTPLSSCFGGFDAREKDAISFKIGEIAARINSIEIVDGHPYIASRSSWESYISDRLRERLTPLLKYDIITHDEIELITDNMRRKKAVKTNAFLHLDMRRVNMIYSNGDIYILDAENCEFGDPLAELATIDVGGELNPPLIRGYKSVCGERLDLADELYSYYFMERLSLVLELFMSVIKTDTQAKRLYLEKFYEMKRKLLS